MKKIHVLQTRNNITYVIFVISLAIFLLYVGPFNPGIELNIFIIAAIITMIQSGIAIIQFKIYFLTIEKSEISFRFPRMKKVKKINTINGIKNIKENWMGLSFYSEDIKYDIRTESAWRTDKKNILNALRNLEKTKKSVSHNLKQEDNN